MDARIQIKHEIGMIKYAISVLNGNLEKWERKEYEHTLNENYKNLDALVSHVLNNLIIFINTPIRP